MDKNYSQF